MMPRSNETRRAPQVRAITLRFPPDVYMKLVDRAAKNRRSINSEAVYLIEQNLEGKVAA